MGQRGDVSGQRAVWRGTLNWNYNHVCIGGTDTEQMGVTPANNQHPRSSRGALKSSCPFLACLLRRWRPAASKGFPVPVSSFCLQGSLLFLSLIGKCPFLTPDPESLSLVLMTTPHQLFGSTENLLSVPLVQLLDVTYCWLGRFSVSPSPSLRVRGCKPQLGCTAPT